MSESMRRVLVYWPVLITVAVLCGFALEQYKLPAWEYLVLGGYIGLIYGKADYERRRALKVKRWNTY